MSFGKFAARGSAVDPDGAGFDDQSDAAAGTELQVFDRVRGEFDREGREFGAVESSEGKEAASDRVDPHEGGGQLVPRGDSRDGF